MRGAQRVTATTGMCTTASTAGDGGTSRPLMRVTLRPTGPSATCDRDCNVRCFQHPSQQARYRAYNADTSKVVIVLLCLKCMEMALDKGVPNEAFTRIPQPGDDRHAHHK